MATVEIGPLDDALAELGAHAAERVQPLTSESKLITERPLARREVDAIPTQLRVDSRLHALWFEINRLCEWTAVTADRMEQARDALVRRMYDLRWNSLLRPLDRHVLQNADYTSAQLVPDWQSAIALVLWARCDSEERNAHRSRLGAAFAAMSRWLRAWAPIYKRIGEGWSRRVSCV